MSRDGESPQDTSSTSPSLSSSFLMRSFTDRSESSSLSSLFRPSLWSASSSSVSQPLDPSSFDRRDHHPVVVGMDEEAEEADGNGPRIAELHTPFTPGVSPGLSSLYRIPAPTPFSPSPLSNTLQPYPSSFSPSMPTRANTPSATRMPGSAPTSFAPQFDMPDTPAGLEEIMDPMRIARQAAEEEIDIGTIYDEEQKLVTIDGRTPVLQNIVATCNLKVRLDLMKVSSNTRNSEYNPRRFSAVIMRLRDPKTTALIFSSGKVVIAGARTERQSRTAARKFARIIQKIGYNVRYSPSEHRIQNIVASVNLGFNLRLEMIHTDHHAFTTYEPELFPGLVYRMYNPKVVLLVFVSGKVVITGGKNRQDIEDAFRNIYPTLSRYKKEIRG